MKSNLQIFVLISTIVSAVMISACGQEGSMPQISSISYTFDSGGILPEHRAHNEYLIKPDGILFSTQGRSEDTQVMEGQWQYPVDEKLARDLLDLAAEKRCRDYERVESPDPPDGGGTESILINFTNGDTCSLYFDPGTTYRGAETLLEQIRQLIRSLDPASAVIVQQP